MTARPLSAALLLGLLLTAPGVGAAQTPASATDDAVAARLANAPAEALAYDPSATGLNWANAAVYSLYHEDAPHAFWFRDTQLTEHGTAIVTALREASGHGLDPTDYDLPTIERLLQATTTGERAELDLRLTRALLFWLADIDEGRVVLSQDKKTPFTPRRQASATTLSTLRAFRDTNDPGDFLASRHPRHVHYRQLRAAYARLAAATADWPEVTTGKTLHPGDSDPRVVQIRRRLAATGQFFGSQDSPLYDEAVKAAVVMFQARHGLDPDGIAGANTIAAMNVSHNQRLAQLRLNLERWRWLDRELGNPHVLVDIAAYDLQGVRDDRVELEMRVIVGKRYHETPVFSDRIRYIEFNPYWNLTPSIARHETVPKIIADDNYLADKHIRVFDGWGADAQEVDPKTVDWPRANPVAYKFRQDPGPWNALGTMKFIFPNAYSVYLHDTPNHDLFDRAARAFSHGCIRLSEPDQLALWLLEDLPGFDEQALQTVLDSQQRTVQNLPARVPVHITYETAWTDRDGALHFAEDIYSRDDRLAAALTTWRRERRASLETH